MRFRHFKRYYFNLEFDWRRLQYLLDLVRRITPVVRDELDQFATFVAALVEELEEREERPGT